jgi:outer membrane immunogenic protein
MRSPRSYLLATASSVALVGNAAAADMPLKAPPPPIPVVSWAGPYIGVNFGAAFNHSSFTDVDNFAFLLPGGTNDNFWRDTHVGITAGGLLGYNWQSGNVVYGVEGDLNWVDAKSNATIPSGLPVTASSNLQWMTTIRGRVGLVYDLSTLFYVTGGLAIARFSDSWGDPVAGSAFVISSDYTRTGWTAGGGIEHMFAPHWTGRVEALYADFGTATTTTLFAGSTYRTEFRHSVGLLRGALSYKW